MRGIPLRSRSSMECARRNAEIKVGSGLISGLPDATILRFPPRSGRATGMWIRQRFAEEWMISSSTPRFWASSSASLARHSKVNPRSAILIANMALIGCSSRGSQRDAVSLTMASFQVLEVVERSCHCSGCHLVEAKRRHSSDTPCPSCHARMMGSSPRQFDQSTFRLAALWRHGFQQPLCYDENLH